MATTTTKFNVPLRGDIRFTTTTSDLVTAATFQTKPSTAYHAQFWAVATREDATAGSGIYWRRALFRTDANGVLTQVSTTQTPGADIEDNAGWQFLIGATGTTIIVQIAGEGSPCQWAIASDIHTVDAIAIA